MIAVSTSILQSKKQRAADAKKKEAETVEEVSLLNDKYEEEGVLISRLPANIKVNAYVKAFNLMDSSGIRFGAIGRITSVTGVAEETVGVSNTDQPEFVGTTSKRSNNTASFEVYWQEYRRTTKEITKHAINNCIKFY